MHETVPHRIMFSRSYSRQPCQSDGGFLRVDNVELFVCSLRYSEDVRRLQGCGKESGAVPQRAMQAPEIELVPSATPLQQPLRRKAMGPVGPFCMSVSVCAAMRLFCFALSLTPCLPWYRRRLFSG